MIIAAIAVLSLAQQASAGDYFPLTPGTKWTYEVSGDATGAFVQEIGTPEPAGELTLTPVLIKSGGTVVQKVFYTIGPTEVSVLGINPKKLYAKPQPVFKIGTKDGKWEFAGPSPYEDDPGVGMEIKGQSKPVGLRDVLGVKRECLEVKTETSIGVTKGSATVFKRTTIYAKGVGMIENQEVSQTGTKGKKYTQSTKLAKFEQAEVSSR